MAVSIARLWPTVAPCCRPGRPTLDAWNRCQQIGDTQGAVAMKPRVGQKVTD